MIRNSLIARNVAISVANATDHNEGAGSLTLNSLDYNLIEDISGCTITGVTTHNLSGIDPLLLPLSDYGSGIPTHALLPESPARSAGNPALPGSGGNACPSSDARGQNRGLA